MPPSFCDDNHIIVFQLGSGYQLFLFVYPCCVCVEALHLGQLSVLSSRALPPDQYGTVSPSLAQRGW